MIISGVIIFSGFIAGTGWAQIAVEDTEETRREAFEERRQQRQERRENAQGQRQERRDNRGGQEKVILAVGRELEIVVDC